MNRVGAGGQGRERLARLVPARDARRRSRRSPRRRGETRARRGLAAARRRRCAQSLERDAWDGDWYRRGYFDDGTPLGSAASDECRIDSIAQSWAVLSGAADPGARARARWRRSTSTSSAAATAWSLLFTPPFDRTPLDPGYIKGYPPGIRENGGQYTHAALWSVLAFAVLGDGDKAGGAVLAPEPDQPREHARRPSTATRSSPTSPAPTSTPSRRTSGAAAGPGTRARPAGCTAPASSGSSASACAARRSRSTPASRAPGPASRSRFRYHSARYEIAVENPHGVSRGVARARARRRGARRRRDARIPLADDGATHRVRVVLG